MAEIAFPAIIGKPKYPLKETPEDGVIRSKMEDGTVKSRRKFTRNRITYEVSWDMMPETQKQAFDEFYYQTTKGGSLHFDWTHPSNGQTKTVRFTEVPKLDLTVLDYWSVSMIIQEV